MITNDGNPLLADDGPVGCHSGSNTMAAGRAQLTTYIYLCLSQNYIHMYLGSNNEEIHRKLWKVRECAATTIATCRMGKESAGGKGVERGVEGRLGGESEYKCSTIR